MISPYYSLMLRWERWEALLLWRGVTHSMGWEGHPTICCRNCGLKPKLLEHGPFRP